MKDFLLQLFIPHQHNNFRAKLLHNSTLFILVIFIFLLSFLFHTIETRHPDILGISYSITENEILVKTNQVRQENGLSPLTLNAQLEHAAEVKASDMFYKNYWAHFAPDGSTTPWLFIQNSGYEYLYAGENLAKGFTNSSDIVNAWMKSPTHRENMLSSRFKDVGFAIVEGKLQGEDTVLVVEMFGSQNFIPTQTESKTTNEEKPTNNNLLGQSQQVVKIPVQPKSYITEPKIDLALGTRTISLIILFLVLGAFVVDFIFTEKKRITRIVGHNLDHILLVIIFIIFILIQKGGGVL